MRRDRHRPEGRWTWRRSRAGSRRSRSASPRVKPAHVAAVAHRGRHPRHERLAARVDVKRSSGTRMPDEPSCSRATAVERDALEAHLLLVGSAGSILPLPPPSPSIAARRGRSSSIIRAAAGPTTPHRRGRRRVNNHDVSLLTDAIFIRRASCRTSSYLRLTSSPSSRLVFSHLSSPLPLNPTTAPTPHSPSPIAYLAMLLERPPRYSPPRARTRRARPSPARRSRS